MEVAKGEGMEGGRKGGRGLAGSHPCRPPLRWLVEGGSGGGGGEGEENVMSAAGVRLEERNDGDR